MVPVHAQGSKPRHVDDHSALEHGDGSSGHAGTSAARDDGELHVIGQTHQSADLFRSRWLNNQQREFHAQVGGVSGAFHQGAGAGEHTVLGHDSLQTLHEFLTETAFSLVGAPENGDAFADGRHILLGQSLGFAGEAFIYADPHGFGLDKGIIGDEEKLFRNGDCQFPHGFGPVLERFEIYAEDAVDNEILRYGNVGAFVRHETLLVPHRETEPGKGEALLIARQNLRTQEERKT